MPHQLTIDTIGETITASFVDRGGNATSNPADFDHMVWTPSDTTVLTVTADASDPLRGQIGFPGATGTGITIQGQAVQANGSPVLEADGTTPIPAATSDTINVNPGNPVGERLAIGPA